MPLLDAMPGVGIGAIHQTIDGVGIGKDRLNIRTQPTEGTSALRVITDEGDLDRVAQRFHGAGAWRTPIITEPERKLLITAFTMRRDVTFLLDVCV